MTEDEIIWRAADAFYRYDTMVAEKRKLDDELRSLCREYGACIAPHMLRKAVNARLGDKAA